MKLEIGKFYTHELGRSIAVLSEIKTYKWGRQVVIEETDPTGHCMSVTDSNIKCKKGEWKEITKEA